MAPKNSGEEGWEECQDLPAGWRVRASKEGKEFFSPANKYFRGRLAVIKMLLKEESVDQEQFKDFLVNGGWEEGRRIPDGWFYKEGNTASRHMFIAKEGIYLDSHKKALHYVENNPLALYGDEDQALIRNFLTNKRPSEGNEQKQPCKRQRLSPTKPILSPQKSPHDDDFQPGDDSVPEGWMVARDREEDGRGWVKSPGGQKFPSRRAALKVLVDEKSGDIENMRSCLSYEGWVEESELPTGWRLKQRLDSRGMKKGKYIMSQCGKSFDRIEDLDKFLFLGNHQGSLQEKIKNIYSRFPDFTKENKSEGVEAASEDLGYEEAEVVIVEENEKVAVEKMVKVEFGKMKIIEVDESEENEVEIMGEVLIDEIVEDEADPKQVAKVKNMSSIDLEQENTVEVDEIENKEDGVIEKEVEAANINSMKVEDNNKINVKNNEVVIEKLADVEAEDTRTIEEEKIGEAVIEDIEESEAENIETIVDEKVELVDVGKTEEAVFRNVGEVEDDNMKTIEVGEMQMVEAEKMTKAVVEAAKKEKVDKVSSQNPTVPRYWSLKPQGDGRRTLVSPTGSLFATRRLALKQLLERGAPEGELQQMRDCLVYEGWRKSPYLPEGWRLRTGVKGTVLLTHKMKQFTLKAALLMMEASGRYPENIIQDLKELERKEAEENKTSIDADVLKPEFSLSTKPRVESVGENDPEQEPKLSEEETGPADTSDTTLPKGWKMLSSGGCSQLQSPRGGCFSSRRQAMRKMVVQEYPQEELDQMRDCLKYEGWQDHPNLPHNWKMKVAENGDKKSGGKKLRTVFMAEDGTILPSGLLALKHLRSKTDVPSQTFELFIDFLKAETKNVSEEKAHDETLAVETKNVATDEEEAETKGTEEVDPIVEIDSTELVMVEMGREGENTGPAEEEKDVTEDGTEETEQLENEVDGEESKVEEIQQGEAKLETLSELLLEKTEKLTEKKAAEEIFMEGVKPDESVDSAANQVEKEGEGDHSKKGRSLQETPMLEIQISKRPKLETPRLVTPRLETPRLMAPKMAKQRWVTSKLVTPRLETPRLVVPKMVKQRLVTPTLVNPRFVTPRLVTPKLMTPKRVTPKMVTPKLVTPKLETSSELLSVRKRLADLTGLGITIVGKEEPVEEKKDAQKEVRVRTKMENSIDKSGGNVCANNCGFTSHAKNKNKSFIMRRHQEKCASGQRVRNPRC